MDLPCLKESKDGICLNVQAVPRSSRTEIVDLCGERCRIKVKAPPVEGEANTALVEFLARVFGLTKRQVTLGHGSRGKLKSFILKGTTLESAKAVLRKHCPPKPENSPEGMA